MKNSDRRGSRLISLGGFLVVVLLVYLGVLYNTQVVHGAEYLEQSVRTITKNETVEASRGIITDRNGQALVSNRPCYNLTFDSSLLKAGQDQNDAILRLIDLCRSKAIPWEDNLPISRSAPFTYTVDAATSTQKSRFLKYLQDLKLIPDNATADSLSAQSLNQMSLTADQLLADMKGRDSDEEIAAAEHAAELLGAGAAQITDYSIPGTDVVHRAVLFEKIRPTPVKYPRAFAKIKKSPL